MPTRRSQRSAAANAKDTIIVAEQPSHRMSRPRRTAGDSSASVSRGPAPATSRSPESMRFTVKTSSSKLREATRASSAGGPSITVNSRDHFGGGEIIEGKRSRNVRKSYVMESESEEDEEMEEGGEDEDAEGEVIEEDDDLDAEGEDDDLDADGDVDMDAQPPPPTIKVSQPSAGKTKIVVKEPPKNDTVTVEQKEMGSDDDDEELSELDSDIADEIEEEEAMQTGNEEDAEGEDEDIEVVAEEEEEEPLDSDDETPAGGSRASTPDLAKLTRRQRAKFDEDAANYLIALPDGMYPLHYSISRTNIFRRGSNEEAFDGRGARYETC
jgi:Ino eighty subunit 2